MTYRPAITAGEFMTIKTQPLELTKEDFRDRAATLQRELRTSQRWCSGYRRMALLGWIAFTAALLWQGDAHADTLPQDSLACVDEPAWVEQMSLMGAGIPALAQGCVFTNRDYVVRVETRTVFSGSSVWVQLAGMEQLVWVDGGVLLP